MSSEPTLKRRPWRIEDAEGQLPARLQRNLVEGSRLVVTRQMSTLAAGMPSALKRGAAIAVSGPWGSGKSTLLAAVAAVADVHTATANIPRGYTDKQLWDEIAAAVIGAPVDGTAAEMRKAAREHLTRQPTLLIVDEAQHISPKALEQLRWLWDHPFPQFAIILAGSNLLEHLDAQPAIGTRIDRRILLDYQATDQMVDNIRAHHPGAADTDPDVLAAIDAHYAKGSWRAWSKLLLELRDLNQRGPITIAQAQRAIHAIAGYPVDLTCAAER
ncbi:ATP-binding protein [Nocardioidaceae bacterium]|nr:ATP-binding protein [Nocardioidaceae bacterium]